LAIHAAQLTLPTNARPDDEVLSVGKDGRNQIRNQLRAIAAIAVEENDNLAVMGNGGDASPAGSAIAPPWF
jgi:hypothetical protein